MSELKFEGVTVRYGDTIILVTAVSAKEKKDVDFLPLTVEYQEKLYSAGRIPLRRAGDGSRPYRGASADGDWMGFVPFDELPHVVDPPAGRAWVVCDRGVADTALVSAVVSSGAGAGSGFEYGARVIPR